MSKAGGFGVLGAVGFTPEQLEVELDVDRRARRRQALRRRHRHPRQVRGHGRARPREARGRCSGTWSRQGTASSPTKILADHGVPELPDGEASARELLGWTEATATPQVEVALQHPKVRLIANALGTPPAGRHRAASTTSGRLVAALCGAAEQALQHKDAGVDIVIAQGTEGGGHTGDVGSMVLWPRGDRRGRAHAGARRRWHRHAAGRSPPRWPWARRACGPARCG